VRPLHAFLVIALLLAWIVMVGAENQPEKPAAQVKPFPKLGPGTEIMNKDFIVEELTRPPTDDEVPSLTFSSNAILFDYGSAKLREASFPQLMELAKALNDPALAEVPFFFVDGHTCSIGTDERNCRLAVDRVKSVVSFLVEKGGVPPERLKARGFGQRDPMVSNDTEEHRKQNRRVVIKSGLLALKRDEEKRCKVVEAGK
jgi:outer membrane protein OmpA-like peptidoglycan-associated protein